MMPFRSTLLLALPLLAIISVRPLPAQEETSEIPESEVTTVINNMEDPALTRDFAQFLARQGDFREAAWEYERYLFLTEDPDPQAALNLGLLQFRLDEPQKSLDILKTYSPLADSQTRGEMMYLKGYILSSRGDWQALKTLLKRQCTPDLPPAEVRPWDVLRLTYHTYNHEWEAAADITEQHASHASFLKLNEDLQGYRQKSPALAAGLSLVLPGMGKIYARQEWDAVMSLFTLGIAGAFTGWSYHNEGLESWRTWAYGITAGVFYTANVYGSYQAALRYNSHQRNQLKDKADALREEYPPY